MSVPNQPVLWLDAGRWQSLLTFLSMDSVRPWWPAMGLDLTNEQTEEVVRLARQTLLEAISARQASTFTPSDQGAQPTGKAPSAGREPSLESAVSVLMVPAFLQRLADTCGPLVYRQVLQFGRFLFAPARSNHPEIFAWHELFEHCLNDSSPGRGDGNGALDKLFSPGPPDPTFSAEIARVSSVALSPPSLQLPLSSWDLGMCAVRLIDDADDQAPEHPARIARETALVAQYRVFWRALTTRITTEKADDLQWNATQAAWEQGTLPREEMLAHPGSLFEEENG